MSGDDDGNKVPLWPFALIALAGAMYAGVQLALNVWRSWLLAAAIVAAGFAVFWLLWPQEWRD